MSKPIFAVLGATGAQGTSVVHWIKEWNKTAKAPFAIRAIARNIDSEKVKNLRDQWKDVEFVSADMTKKAALLQAFKGVSHLFALTSFWDKESMHKEVEIGKNIGDAAKESGVKYVWFSELANSKKISNGKYSVTHFSDKAVAGDYLRSLGLKVIAVMPGCYGQNFLGMIAPQKNAEGVYVYTFVGSEKMTFHFIDINDIGKVVAGTLNDPDAWVGKFIPIAEELPLKEYLEEIGRDAGKTVQLSIAPAEAYSKFYPGAAEMADMFGWWADYGYYGPNPDLKSAHKLAANVGAKLVSHKEFIKAHHDQFLK